MQGPAWGVLLLALLLCNPQPCAAEEFNGKLQRVDLTTVTLFSPDNQRLVVTVDLPERQKAAAHLGKSVTVLFRVENGEQRAVLFRSMY